MHKTRLIVALVTLPLLYLYVTALSPIFFLLLMIVLSTLAQWEFNSMYKTKPPLSVLSLIIGIMLICSSYISTGHQLAMQSIVFIIGFMALTTLRLFVVKNPEASLKDLSPAIVGIAYIPMLMLPQWQLRLIGSEWIVILYGCVWFSDSLAYYVGKGIGKKRLYYEVSPNKTMEGAIGSLIGGIISALIIGWLMGITERELFNGFNGLLKLALLGLLIGFITIIGDLVESMFKRDAEIKDSGTLLPGHGGFLDKIDGSLFVGPVVYLYIILIQR